MTLLYLLGNDRHRPDFNLNVLTSLYQALRVRKDKIHLKETAVPMSKIGLERDKTLLAHAQIFGRGFLEARVRRRLVTLDRTGISTDFAVRVLSSPHRRWRRDTSGMRNSAG